jgi:hypothetical protein
MDLQELIGLNVVAVLEDEVIEGKVIDVVVNDYYFFEKNEPIQIYVNILPDHDVEDEEMCSGISLDCIYYKHK